jgi:hypothetical protein
MASGAEEVAGRERRAAWLVVLGIAGVALAFAAYTEHAWEDFYIAYRASKNLALGNGLVYQPGERLQAFSSPVGVLLPALLVKLTGNTSDALVLWLFRLAGVALLAGSGLIVFRARRAVGMSEPAAALALFLMATQIHIVAFSTNGQESAFLVFLVCATWAGLATRGVHVWLLGATLAAFQWSRPDGFVYWGCLVLGMLLWGAARAPGPGVRRLRSLAAAVAVAAALYAPWVIGCWLYYGNPVPHSIVAKSLMGPSRDPAVLAARFLSFPLDVFVGSGSSSLAFGPVYYYMGGGWPQLIVGTASQLGTLVGLYWLIPFAGAQARALSFAFYLAQFYLTRVIVPAPWYLAPTTTMGVLALGFIAQDVLGLRESLLAGGRTKEARSLAFLSGAVAAGVAAFSLTVLVLSADQLRLRQREIEEGTRAEIGRWLRRAASHPLESVFLEPLGYVGFYSGLKMLDYPGLASDEVVQGCRKLQTQEWPRLIRHLQPDWLVLRPVEERGIRLQDPGLLESDYVLARVFDAADRLARYGYIPGRGYLDHDARFAVYRRRASGGALHAGP